MFRKAYFLPRNPDNACQSTNRLIFHLIISILKEKPTEAI